MYVCKFILTCIHTIYVLYRHMFMNNAYVYMYSTLYVPAWIRMVIQIVLDVCSGYSTITMITCCSGCDCGVHLQTLILSPDTVYVVGCIWRKVRYCECHPITDRQCYDFVSVVDCAVVIMVVPFPVDADLYLIVCHLQYLYGLSICIMYVI